VRSAVTGLNQDIADLKELIDSPGLKNISGLYGALAPNVSKEARDASALYDKIKAGAGLTALLDLKNASPTGGALGNVSNQEGAKLEGSVAAFDQKQDYETLRRRLRSYLIDLQVARENVLSTFDETYSYRNEKSASDIASGITKTRQQFEEQAPQTGRPSLPPGVTVKRN
jgi:hypothetical protein